MGTRGRVRTRQMLGLFLGALAFTACSSGQKNTEEQPLEELPVAEAATDPVPLEGVQPVDAATTTEPMAEAPPADATAAANPDPAAATPPPTADEAVSPPPTEMSSVAGSGQFEDYSVRSGDTLMQIAFETYGDLFQWRKIYDNNRDRITNPNAVPRGTVLKLEKPSSPVAIDRNGDRYLIKGGDTLGTISDDVYGTKRKWKKLWENNRQLIKDPNKIFAGFYLYYTMSPEERQEADRLKQMKGTAAPLAGGNDMAPAPGPTAQPMEATAPAPATDGARAPTSSDGTAAGPSAAGG